jgi:hypothetical protein
MCEEIEQSFLVYQGDGRHRPALDHNQEQVRLLVTHPLLRDQQMAR